MLQVIISTLVYLSSFWKPYLNHLIGIFTVLLKSRNLKVMDLVDRKMYKKTKENDLQSTVSHLAKVTNKS